MRALTLVGIVLLVLGLMALGLSAVPQESSASDTATCNATSALSITEQPPMEPPVVGYYSLSLDQQTAFQRGLIATNTSVQLEQSLFENVSTVDYNGSLYNITERSQIPNNCPATQNNGPSWQTGVFVFSILSLVGGGGLVIKSAVRTT
jgi:hypothetical protein